MDIKEDQTAPIGRNEVAETVQSNQQDAIHLLVTKIMNYLNEKRDAYNGIVSSIIFMIDSKDDELVGCLKKSLIEFITSNPMRFGGKVFISKALYRLTSERPQFVVDLFEQIINTTQEWATHFCEKSQVLHVQIIALKAISQAEQRTKTKLSSLTQEHIDKLCNEAMLSCDDSTKIDTLCLILESRSTTKVLEERELEMFKLSFQDALSLQEPALRQVFLAVTNKLLKRVKDSLRVVMRESHKFSDEDRHIIGTRYTSFLQWLVCFCLDSIYCSAYFGSFILTMSTLKLVIEHVTFSDENLPIKQLFSNRRCYDSILSCLNDSFEENKILALDILLRLPNNEEFINDKNLESLEHIAYHLVSSVNPAHSLTCQYVFKLIVGLKQKQLGAKATKNQLLLQYLTELIRLVESGIEDTRKNSVVALKHNAIYPKLSCIRALLNEVDIDDLNSNREEWTHLASRMVNASIEACQAISFIVCNLNPETIGHLPMDLKPIDAEALSKSLNISLNISDGQLQTITSQMLLISGWKTIKECSLSMGAMCTYFWWPKERIKGKRQKYPGLKTDPILNSSDIKKIVDFFDHYLRNLRHRGAFEQAYNGFIMVTKRIWHDQKFKSLLTATLMEIMNDFKNEETVLNDKKVECLKAYVTRRSAGLPFIVQAILNSEHKHDSKTLRWVMDCLFDILDNPKSETYQRIHCLNILKALIKESSLGEKVIPYIEKTFAITMESFKSDLFPIRNCANMLLKATVDRTFGVNRLRDDIHKRNKLSFERFFNECRDLHPKMLKLLEEGVEDRRCLAAVHSVFIILFRLKPSLNPNEGFNCDKIIKPFIKPILELTYTCPDFKLRELAARLAVQLEIYCDDIHDLNTFKKHIQDLANVIFADLQDYDRNRLHGALILTKNWIERFKLTNDLGHKKLILDFAQQVVKKILLSNNFQQQKTTCGFIKMAALDVTESYCLVQPEERNLWLIDLYPSIKNLALVGIMPRESQSEFHLESLIFKYVTIILMSNCFTYTTEFNNDMGKPDQVLDIMADIITMPSNRLFSVSLQASFIRLLRQLICESSDDFFDKLFDNLDLDSTAAHMTPFDKLKQKSENDFEQERWARYCGQIELKRHITESLLPPIKRLFNFTYYDEFKSRSKDSMVFSSKFSNTPRGVELMALAYNTWDLFDLGKNLIWQQEGEKTINKIDFLSKFIRSLPDCDIKCLAMLCVSKLFNYELMQISNGSVKLSQDSLDIRILEDFTGVLDELADGHHSFVIRETCSEVLNQCLKIALEKKCDLLQRSLMNLLSALIKLCQDEEHEIRQCSFRIMTKLRSITSVSNDDKVHALAPASRLNNLIALVTTELFDPSNCQDIINCFELSMRIIFNHTKNFSTTLNEEREILFDKTKLNTFADHVATIQGTLYGLRSFFRRCYQRNECTKVNLNSLRLSHDVLRELETVYELANDNNTGDYSWRLKKSVLSSTSNTFSESRSEKEHGTKQVDTNNATVDRILCNVVESLNYFSAGYWNMLTDTDYPYHELSLFKRFAFVKFVLECTGYETQNKRINTEIQEKLQRIVRESCSTTMLCKCLSLLNG